MKRRVLISFSGSAFVCSANTLETLCLTPLPLLLLNLSGTSFFGSNADIDMALRPAHIVQNPYLYPVGNTPAVCLTDSLAPEIDAKVLLLGCGDVRNIMFTVYSGGSSGGLQQSLDHKAVFLSDARSPKARLHLLRYRSRDHCSEHRYSHSHRG